MNILFIECQMGAAGDMLMGALFELLSEEEQSSFLQTMNQLPFPDVHLSVDRIQKCGIYGTKMNIHIHGTSEDHIHDHDHTHSHEHGHAHRSDHSHEHVHTHESHDQHNHSHASYTSIQKIVSDLTIENEIKEDTLHIYRLIGEAEAKAHNTTLEQIHFHEVGSLDAIMDVIGCCKLIHMLNPDHIIVSPIHVGRGTVRCAHGILPVPAPATAEILKGVPIYSKQIDGELCTPTGAAILKNFADEFSHMPEMVLDKTGYGMGYKDFKSANCVRAFWGTDFSGEKKNKRS